MTTIEKKMRERTAGKTKILSLQLVFVSTEKEKATTTRSLIFFFFYLGAKHHYNPQGCWSFRIKFRFPGRWIISGSRLGGSPGDAFEKSSGSIPVRMGIDFFGSTSFRSNPFFPFPSASFFSYRPSLSLSLSLSHPLLLFVNLSQPHSS